jgi:hypothetical protein
VISTDPAWSTIALLAVTAVHSLSVKSRSVVKENELKKRCNDFGGTGNPDKKDLISTPLVCAIRIEFKPPNNENVSYI